MLAALGLSGCQSFTADGFETAQVRFVDASPGGPGMDVYLNGSGAAYGLSFGTVTSYIPVGPGEFRAAAMRANTGQAMVSAHATLAGMRQYTALISNSLGSLQETIYPDASAPAPAGTVGVRALNAGAGIGPVDVYLLPNGGGAPVSLARNLPYLGDGGYLDVPAGTGYEVAVVPAGTAPPAVSADVLHGIAVGGGSGAVRTLVIGDAAPASGHGLTGFVLDDADTR